MVLSNPIYVFAFPEVEEVSLLASRRWNEWLDMDLFVFVDDPTKAHVIVVGQPPNPYFYGVTVSVTPKVKVVQLFFPFRATTMVHEFGHVLGLNHDPDNPFSIMYPNSQGRAAGTLEDKDRELLVEFYGNGLWTNKENSRL